MGGTSTTMMVVFAALTAIFWVLAVTVAYGWLGTSGTLYGQTEQAWVIYGVLALIGTVVFYKIEL